MSEFRKQQTFTPEETERMVKVFKELTTPTEEKFPLRSKCEEKAKRLDMPHFTLIACDNHATTTIFFWLEHAKKTGLPADKVKEAEDILVAMQKWRDEHPEFCKNPD